MDPPFSLQVQSLLYGLKVSHMGLLDSVALSGAVQLFQKMQAKKCGNKLCVGLSLLFLENFESNRGLKVEFSFCWRYLISLSA